jgi:amidase
VDSHSEAPHPACVTAVQAAAQRCAELGHHVEEAAPAYDADAFHRANIIFWCSFVAAAIAGTAEALGRKPGPDNLEASVWASYQFGSSLRALDLEWAYATANAVSRGVAPFFERYDVLLTPVMGTPPEPLGALDANDARFDAQGWYDRLFLKLPYTALYNLTGQPAISLPLGFADGLPIGVQAVARPGDEAVLLKLAAQLEQAMPWSGRVPPIHSSRAPTGPRS